MPNYTAFTIDPPRSGPENMAADLAILSQAEKGATCCRAYRWNSPWVSVGRHQDPNRDLVSGVVPFVRRPTGGKAVLHGHDWTVGMAIPLARFGVGSRSLGPLYRRIVAPVVDALSRCGLRACLAEERGAVDRFAGTGDCFAIRAPLDIVDRWTGQKLGGCALRVTDSAVLAQISIPVGSALVPPESVILGAKVESYFGEDAIEWSDGFFPEAMGQTFLAFARDALS